MNAKANFGTIFGNYVTKIDSASLKPFEESIVDETPVITPEVTPTTDTKADIEKRREDALYKNEQFRKAGLVLKSDGYKYYDSEAVDKEANQNIIEINAKYDAELTALEAPIVAESVEKPYIDSTKKHSFKRANKQNIVTDKTAEDKKDNCK